MKKLATIAFICMLLSSIVFAAPSSHRCPLCAGNMIWTGKTKTEWGKLTYEMKCPSGHISWEVDESNNSRSRSYNGDGCQYDGYSMYFTGKTKTEWGKLLKQYKCASGHIEWRTR